MSIRALSMTTTIVAIMFNLLHAKGSVENYELLRGIPSPYEMIDPLFPSEYRFNVALSGDVAEEMKSTLEKMGYPAPHYEEIRSKKDGFRLVLSNPEYPVETRDLISGILNPTEMIESLLSSLLKYRNPEKFGVLKDETNAERTRETIDGKVCYRITLTPRGERFNYHYEDMGSYVQELWLTKLVTVIDSAHHRIYELSIDKHSRHVPANATRKPKVESSAYNYRFEYAPVNDHLLPSDLVLHIDGKESVVLKASYRPHDDGIVFEHRSICYQTPSNKKNCLSMQYQEATDARASATKKARPGKRGKHLIRAARLSRKATSALKDGDFSSAVRNLQKLVDDYPGTPQAIEAKKVLSTFPY